MKARIKATGEIVEVTFLDRKTHTDEQVYMTCEGNLIEESRLDFNVEESTTGLALSIPMQVWQCRGY